MNAIRLYFRYLDTLVRSQMQYQTSYLMQGFGCFIVTGIEFLGIWALFTRFGSIKGWTMQEIGLFYGIVSVSFPLAEFIGRGFDLFPNMVKTGDFDRLLLRPRATALQIAGQDLSFKHLGKCAQGAIVLIWAGTSLHVFNSLAHLVLLLFTMLGAICLFYGLFILQATFAFWTIESLEVMNVVTYGGSELSNYPLTVYRPWFRRFFTFIVPLACVNYFPTLVLMNRPDPLGTPVCFQCCAPILGPLFLLFTLQFWKLGVRHYRSTGS